MPEPQAVIDLQAAATALGRGDLQYNPFTELCSNKTITWAFSQVKEWLDSNPVRLNALSIMRPPATATLNP